VVLENSFVI